MVVLILLLIAIYRELIKSKYMIAVSNDIKTPQVIVHVFHERRQNLSLVVENTINLVPVVVVQTYFTTQQSLEIECVSLLQNLDCSFQIDLVFIKATFLAGIRESSLDSQSELPSCLRAINVLFQVFEQIYKAHFFCHKSCIVVQSRPI